MSTNYKTKHKMFILNYFMENQGKHISAEDIYKAFLVNNIKVGMATIYRNLKSIEKDGVIIKYSSIDGGATCYEYSSKKYDYEKYHFKCEECGKLLHVECVNLDFLNKHMEDKHKFNINKMKTVFYGVCGNCC